MTRNRPTRKTIGRSGGLTWAWPGAAALLAMAALLGARLPGPSVQDYSARLAGPSLAHWLGSDQLGRDVVARVLWAGLTDLPLIGMITLLTAALGTLLGLFAQGSSALGHAATALTDGLLAFPNLLLILVILTALGAGFAPLVLAVTLTGAPLFVRLTRSLAATEQAQPYAEAARALGASGTGVLLRHVLPNVVTPLVAQALLFASEALLVLAALNFLGLGTPPPSPSWGGMLQESRLYFLRQPWAAVAPGVAVLALAWALGVLGRRVGRGRLAQRGSWL